VSDARPPNESLQLTERAAAPCGIHGPVRPAPQLNSSVRTQHTSSHERKPTVLTPIRTEPVRPYSARIARCLLGALGLAAAAAATACAHGRRPGSYLPVGASAPYGDRTNDGLTLLLRVPADTAMARVRAALQAEAYSASRLPGRDLRLRTAARALGADTTLVVTAEVIPVALPAPAASVVLTGTYTVPSRGVRDAPVLQRPDEVDPLYARLGALASAIRRISAPAP
jgi:hypothetical protein